MKLLILAAGSYGDVAPYTGLGAHLRQLGHEVALAAPESFGPLVAGAGLEFRPLAADPGGGSGGLLGRAGAFIQALGEGMVTAASGDVDLLLLSATTAPLGWHLAEALGRPSLGVYLQPVAPTGEFGPVVGGTRSLGRFGNRAAGGLSLRVVDRLHAGPVRQLRARLGLPAASSRSMRRRQEQAGWPVLHGFSPTLLPRPADWRPGLDVVGNWWPYSGSGSGSGSGELPDAVEDFLQAGPPPVFVGFGSMAKGEGERLGELAVRALRQAGVRGVLQAGWAGLAAPASDDVLVVGELPHARLFPRMAAVVHHAGAGTAAAGLSCGLPAVPVPVMADQPFWARRLAALGAATEPVPFADLTADRLADAVRRAVREPAYRQAAARAARAIAAEDGAGQVAVAVERAGRMLER